MKTIDEIYNELQNDNELRNSWKEAKDQNQKVKKIAIIVFVVIDLLILLFCKNIINSIVVISYIMFIVLIMNVIVGTIILVITKLSEKQTEFTNQYKNKVIKRIIDNFYSNAEYFPDKPMPKYIYEKPQYEYYNCYNSHDYFEAMLDNKYSIQMAEILAEEEKENIDEYINRYAHEIQGETVEKKKERITKFNGLFAKVDLEKSINCELRIMQDGKLTLENDRLNMDSSEFEKYFDVKSSNKIIAMQILTSDIMEELVEFENKTKMQYDICIINSELYLRFHFGTLNVDVDAIKNEALDKDVLSKYFYMINFSYNLSKKIIETIENVEI